MTAGDPLLAALADAASARREPITKYGCCSLMPASTWRRAPAGLADLAEAAGMSISGVRIAYTKADIDRAARAIGADHQRHTRRAVQGLLAHAEPSAASGRVITAA